MAERRAVKLIALALAMTGCGRVGFDSLTTNNAVDGDAAVDGDGQPDPGIDAPEVVPDMCPPASFLTDDFEAGSLSIGPTGIWQGDFRSAVTVSQTQGRLVVAFPAASASASHAGVFSKRFDFTTGCALVMSPVVPLASTAAYAYLTVEEPMGANRARTTLAVGAGILEIRRETSAGLMIVGTLPYDPAAHRWWRLRAGAGLIAWETSGNRVNWTTHREEAAYFDLSNVQVVVGAGTDLASTNAGTAAFDGARIYVP